jgi:phthalate 3,4-dioxygenase beta subunit
MTADPQRPGSMPDDHAQQGRNANRRPLALDDRRHLEAQAWLIDEAYLLDDRRYEEWLATLADDVRYVMPVTLTRALGSDPGSYPEMAHYDEDKHSLSLRVARFRTQYAWAEDPPSRQRHFVTNVRTFETDSAEDIFVESAVLLFRSRGDVSEPSLLSARRADTLRRADGGWLLRSRLIQVDESVLRTQNLAVFL